MEEKDAGEQKNRQRMRRGKIQEEREDSRDGQRRIGKTKCGGGGEEKKKDLDQSFTASAGLKTVFDMDSINEKKTVKKNMTFKKTSACSRQK